MSTVEVAEYPALRHPSCQKLIDETDAALLAKAYSTTCNGQVTNRPCSTNNSAHANGFADHALQNGHAINGFVKMPSSNGVHVNGDISPIKKTHNTLTNGTVKNLEKSVTYREVKESFEKPPFITTLFSYFGFYLLIILGFISQALFPPRLSKEKNREGYPPLYDKFAMFYSLYVYRRVKDCWNFPICSVPGAEVVVKERVTEDNGWSFKFTGNTRKCLNLGSYNYLGFSQSSGPCSEYAIDILQKYGASTGATRQQYGTCDLHDELERLVAEYLGVEDAITCGMGFATNSLNIPTLLSPGCLVLSDEKNHASLILGLKVSGATIKVFHHNNVAHLEKMLRTNIYEGQPDQPIGEYKPWKKIFIFVEGIYSMEGTIVRLPEVIALKKKYKAYLYLDEAHSIGALGNSGRGVVDYFGCDVRDVDIMMGTFTKSFGSNGGYIAGSKVLIDYLRKNSYAHKYAVAMSPPVAAQIIAVLKILMGRDGTDLGKRKIASLEKNTHYFRRRLAQIGVITYGNEDSPVIPILVYFHSKIAVVVRTLIQHNIATVGVGYPACPLREGRIRICLSAAHTKEQLDNALDVIAKIASKFGLIYSSLPRDPNVIEY